MIAMVGPRWPAVVFLLMFAAIPAHSQSNPLASVPPGQMLQRTSSTAPLDAAVPQVDAVPTQAPYLAPVTLTGQSCHQTGCSFEDRNGQVLAGDPLLDSPSLRPGWFTGLEGTLIKPRVSNRLVAVVPGANPDSTIRASQTGLDWTFTPRIEIGYRMPEGAGEFLLNYRFLVTDGDNDRAALATGPPTGFARSRLDYHLLDLDYASHEFSLTSNWEMKWRLGARLAQAFFDTRTDTVTFDTRVSNSFIGAGPHLGLDLWRYFDNSGFALFGRLEGATPIGRVTQSFEEMTLAQKKMVVWSGLQQRDTQAAPMLHLQAGLAWIPALPGSPLRLSFGYQYEQWWQLGKLDLSAAEVIGHGIFFRLEYGF